MPPPERRDVLRARIELRTGDTLAVDLTPVGLDERGFMIYAPPFPIAGETIAGVNIDVFPARSVIDFGYERKD